MHRKARFGVDRRLAILSAAVIGIGFTKASYGTTYTSSAADGEQIGTTSYGNHASAGFFDIIGAGYTHKDWGVLDFGTGALGLPTGSTVSSVNSDLTLTLNYNEYSFNTTTPITLSFYLASDNTTSLTGTALSYQSPSTYTGGLNAPGQTGSFAAGTDLIPIGTGSYVDGQASDGDPIQYSLTLNAQAQQDIKSEINSGSNVRIVVASNESDGNQASFYGATSAHVPQAAFDLNTSTLTPNGSILYLGAPGSTAKTGSINLGKQLTINGVPTYCALQGQNTTTTVQLSNGSSVATDTLSYTSSQTNMGATTTTPGPNPIAGGGSAFATVGLNAANTTAQAGNTVSGSATFTNSSNTLTDSTPVTVNVNPVLILQERFVDSKGTDGNETIDVGKVLVGTTGTVNVPLTTTNPVNLTDYSQDALTVETLNANQSSTAFSQTDIFNGETVGTLSAMSGPTALTFDNNQTYNVTGQVTVTASGSYGYGTPVTEGNITQNYTSDYTSFDQPTITGDGLQGENDSMRVYLKWAGYQAAAVSGNTTATLAPGGTATLSNALSNDNTYTPSGGPTYNNGLRAAAWVTGVTFNQNGWGQTGLTASTDGSGTVLNSDGSNTNASITFDPSHSLNGTYGATLTVNLENEQDIQGATANDVAPVVFSLQTTVSSNPSVESGTYLLTGGTLAAPATNLTGSFTQSGGTSTFAGISGTGTVAVSGGKLTLATSSGLSTVKSLSISGNGTFDIGNNHVIINYGGGPDPISSIAALLASGYNGGQWNGTGIISNAAAANSASYGVGFADSADPGNPAGLSSGTIELKYTLLGDADLNGIVNGIDFGIVAANFNQGVTSWDQGDFDYSHIVNGIDFGDLAANFNQGVSGASAGASAADWEALLQFASANGLLADVPEPGSITILAAGAAGLMARKRKRS